MRPRVLALLFVLLVSLSLQAQYSIMQVGTVGNEASWQACASPTGIDYGLPWSRPMVAPNPQYLTDPPTSPIQYAIGITNNLSNPDVANPPFAITGFNPFYWTGFWMAKYWFILPPDAVFPEFRLDRVNVDDRARIEVNGFQVGHFSLQDATGAGSFNTGTCAPDGVLPPEDVNYISGAYPVFGGAPVPAPLYADRLNYILVRVMDTGDWNLFLPPVDIWAPDGSGDWDNTYLALEANVRYVQRPPVPGTQRLIATAMLMQFEGAGYAFTKTVLVKNTGTGTAMNVKLTLASMDNNSAWKWTNGSDWHYVSTDFPIVIGNIPPGGTGVAIVTYPWIGSHGTPVIERYGGTFDGGMFNTSLRSKVP